MPLRVVIIPVTFSRPFSCTGDLDYAKSIVGLIGRFSGLLNRAAHLTISLDCVIIGPGSAAAWPFISDEWGRV